GPPLVGRLPHHQRAAQPVLLHIQQRVREGRSAEVTLRERLGETGRVAHRRGMIGRCPPRLLQPRAMFRIYERGSEDYPRALAALARRGDADLARVEPDVRAILDDVRARGDAAVLALNER